MTQNLKKTFKTLLPENASEGPASHQGWSQQDKWAILKAIYRLCGPRIIHQWTICPIIKAAVCKSEADSLVQSCKNTSTHILAWHRQPKTSWNNTPWRGIKAPHFPDIAKWKWQAKYWGEMTSSENWWSPLVLGRITGEGRRVEDSNVTQGPVPSILEGDMSLQQPPQMALRSYCLEHP